MSTYTKFKPIRSSCHPLWQGSLLQLKHTLHGIQVHYVEDYIRTRECLPDLTPAEESFLDALRADCHDSRAV